MSKTTKIIAALGVVAGLGVAALPAFTYAVDPISGDVEVQVEVQPAIAMTIAGNNDGAQATHTQSINYVIKAVAEGGDVTGLYELDEDEGWVATSDPTAQAGKTYYEQVTITRQNVDNFSPAGIASTQDVTKTLDGHPIPQTPITGTSSSYAALLPNTLFEGSGAEGNGFRSTITVYTNATGGYTLAVKDKDTNTSLMHSTGKYSIPAQNSALAAGVAGWNYDVTRIGTGSGAEFDPAESGETVELSNQGITAADVVIDSLDEKTYQGRQTIVDYNVATSADQATGVYSDIIVYTATAR